MDNFINYIIFLSGSVVGGIIVYVFKTFVEHELAAYRSIEAIRATEFAKGAASFRAAFVDVIFILRQNIEGVHHELIPKIFTKETLIAHEKAKILFEPFLDKNTLIRFNNAWEEYIKCPVNYGTINSNPSSAEESQNCLNHIENLLLYAKMKQ
jgi:hypothetical protein